MTTAVICFFKNQDDGAPKGNALLHAHCGRGLLHVSGAVFLEPSSSFWSFVLTKPRTKPCREFDIGWSSFAGSAIEQVPVVRLFGATPQGQKVCLHLHKVCSLSVSPFQDVPLLFRSVPGRPASRNRPQYPPFGLFFGDLLQWRVTR